MHELIPGLLIALDDDRVDDAVALAGEFVDEVDDPDLAVLQVGIVANFLHKNPQIPLSLVAVMNDETVEYADNRTLGDIGEQFLQVLEERLNGDEDGWSPAATQFLSEFDMRPGSSEVVEQLVYVTAALVTDLTWRMSLISAQPAKALEARQQAIEHARAATTVHRAAAGDDADPGADTD